MAAAVLGNRNGGDALCFVVSGSCWWLWWKPFGGGLRCKLFGLSFNFKLDWDLKNAFAVDSSPVNLVVEVVGASSTSCVISKLVRALKTALFGVLSSPYKLVVEMSPLLVLLLLASLADVGCCGSHGDAWIRATLVLTMFKSLLSLDCCIFLAGLTTSIQVSFFNDARSSIRQSSATGELVFHPLVVSCRSKLTMIYAQHLSGELPEPSVDLKYVGIGLFLVGIGGNFYHHYILAALRKGGEKEYKIPRGGLFNLVICPHYLFEVLVFVGVSCIAQTLYSLSFTVGTAVYLIGRSYATKKWYLSKFEDFPKDVKAFLPFVF